VSDSLQNEAGGARKSHAVLGKGAIPSGILWQNFERRAVTEINMDWGQYPFRALSVGRGGGKDITEK